MQCNGDIPCIIANIIIILFLLFFLVEYCIFGPLGRGKAPKPPVPRKNFNRKRK